MAEAINLDVEIRRNADGEVRVHHYAVNPEHIGHQDFWWGDGNASCDCNRHLFFEDVNDPDLTDDDDDFPCGDTAYSVLSVKRLDTGEVIYRDGDLSRPAK